MPTPFITLPIYLVLSGCGDEILARDQPPSLSDEMREIQATETPGADGATETPDIELWDPVGLD